MGSGTYQCRIYWSVALTPCMLILQGVSTSALLLVVTPIDFDSLVTQTLLFVSCLAAALEQLLKKVAGKYTVGDELTFVRTICTP